MAWHLGWPEAQAISGKEWMAPQLAVLLEDPYDAVRYIANRSSGKQGYAIAAALAAAGFLMLPC